MIILLNTFAERVNLLPIDAAEEEKQPVVLLPFGSGNLKT